MSELFPPNEEIDLDTVGTKKERVRIDETVQQLAGRGASGEYRTPRDQYVFSHEELSDDDLAQAWSTSVAAIRRARRFDESRGFDWIKMRAEFWRRVSSQMGEMLEKQTVHELESTASQYHATVGHIMGALRSDEFVEKLVELQKDGLIEDYLKALNLTARTVKVCVDIEEKLTGAKLAQHIFDTQMQDYDWFVEVVKAFVREPSALENIAKAIQTRRVTRTVITTGEYGDAIAYARGPSGRDLSAAVGLQRKVTQLAEAIGAPSQDDDDPDLDL